MSINGKMSTVITSTRKNAHGIYVKEEKTSTKGGKNGKGINVHGNNVEENALRSEENINSKV